MTACLSVLPTGHNSKLIVMKLYQDVEVVSTEKPIDFDVKGHLSQISKIVIFHPIDLKFEQDLHIASLDWKTNYLRSKGQTSKIKFHLKNRQFSSDRPEL